VHVDAVLFRNTVTTSPGKVWLKVLLWYCGLLKAGVALGVGNGGVAGWNVLPETPLGEIAVTTTTSHDVGSGEGDEATITWPKASGIPVAPGAG